jgi:hypothetical protein
LFLAAFFFNSHFNLSLFLHSAEHQFYITGLTVMLWAETLPTSVDNFNVDFNPNIQWLKLPLKKVT